MFEKKNLLVLFLCLISPILMASESDTYNFSWLDPDKEVYVLQNRKFRKAGKFHFNLGGGMTTSGPFVDATTLQGRAGYFFKEEFGFEILYAKNSGKENSTAASVRNEGGAGSRPFRRIVDNYMGAFFLWAPFYSKINTFNTIIYLDYIFGLGYGRLEETNNRQEFVNQADFAHTTETHNAFLWEIGVRVYLSELISFRLDLTAAHYKAQEAKINNPEDSLYSNYDLSLALGLSF